MRRRDFIKIIAGSAATWPLMAQAQQSAMPVVGFIHILPSENVPTSWLAAFRQGLKEAGFVEGQNVTIEYRWAEGHRDRLPNLVADLIDRKVAVIVTAGGNDPPKAAKAATASIPIVFLTGGDPIRDGIVASLNRPGGNVTGVSLLGAALEAKRLGLLNEIVPGAAAIGVLVDPKFPDADFQLRELQEAAGVIKRKIEIVRASTEAEIDAAFATLAQQGAVALLVTQDPFLTGRREQLLALAVRYKLPAIYALRDFVKIGGLVSYGTDFADGFSQVGIYAGKILKGASPADLPVIQPTKFDLVINLKTAKALGLEVPATLIARADEVIE